MTAFPSEFTGYRIDVNTDLDTPAEFAVPSLPALVVLRDGRELSRLDGLTRQDDLDRALDESQATDEP